MGKKIFVSYKYGDGDVKSLQSSLFMEILEPTTVRHYVDKLQTILQNEGHINKGEKDNESLSDFADSTIESKLRDKIYDSSVTLVMISPNMMEKYTAESDQWIPWEISYSLKEHSRNGRTSSTNAILAIVIPDKNGSYQYFLEENSCPHCNSTTVRTDKTFKIIQKNMFNIKEPIYNDCNYHNDNVKVYTGDHSYIKAVKWSDFENSPSHYIKICEQINDKIDDYNIVKAVN